MSKKIETDWQTFIKFWLVPLIIAGVLFFLYKALTGLIIIGISIFLALALKPLVRKVNGFFTKHFGKDKKHRRRVADWYPRPEGLAVKIKGEEMDDVVL